MSSPRPSTASNLDGRKVTVRRETLRVKSRKAAKKKVVSFAMDIIRLICTHMCDSLGQNTRILVRCGQKCPALLSASIILSKLDKNSPTNTRTREITRANKRCIHKGRENLVLHLFCSQGERRAYRNNKTAKRGSLSSRLNRRSRPRPIQRPTRRRLLERVILAQRVPRELALIII